MAFKLGAYHTTNVNDTHRNVHHEKETCFYGKRIKPEDRVNNDDGGKPLCDECKKP